MSEYLVQQYADNANHLFPDKTAVTSSGMILTYRQLWAFSNQLANCLRSHGVSRQDRVCFCLQRGSRCIISLLGILKADAIYVPIDPKSPQHRIAKIVSDCTPSALICDNQTLSRIAPLLAELKSPPKVFLLGTNKNMNERPPAAVICQEDIAAHPEHQRDYQNVDTDIAYILYTSGSTGSPKGVMISHLNISNYIDWAVDCFAISSRDTILSTAPFHFDMSTFDIWVSLKARGTLAIAVDSLLLFPNALLKYIADQRVTIWKAIPSLLMYIAKAKSLQKASLPSLIKILFGGEAFHPKYLIEWMKAFPDKLFYNVYGPTEATGVSMYYHVKEVPNTNQKCIPIGRASANTEVFSLREDGSEAGPGEVGELHIRGSGLSRGYWNDPEKTRRAFVPNPIGGFPGDVVYKTGDLVVMGDDGNFEFIGRKDDQAKFMGYRIECDEIKNALVSMPRIKDAAVLVLAHQGSDLSDLVAFVEREDGFEKSEILDALASHLPQYMVPTKVCFLEQMPRNDRGKVDKSQLQTYYLKALNT